MKDKEKEIKLKRGQLYWYILEVIGLTLISGGNPLRPIIPLAIKEITKILKEIKNLNIVEERIKKSLKSLEKNEIIDMEEKGSNVLVRLKDKNNLTAIKYSIKALLDLKKKEKKWKGKWFLVFFDVPEIQRNKRNYLRKFLIDIGFYCYQQSIYIFPYECEKAIILIKKIVEGAKYMKYIIAKKIEDEKFIKSYFKL
jgi:CRISPR-associated endonuclease Cas2